jgi:hypothetical protein
MPFAGTSPFAPRNFASIERQVLGLMNDGATLVESCTRFGHPRPPEDDLAAVFGSHLSAT